jgi:hypothetical protein
MLDFTVLKLTDTPDNWGDLNPSAVTVSTVDFGSMWANAIYGPNASVSDGDSIVPVEPGANVTPEAVLNYQNSSDNSAAIVWPADPPKIDISTMADDGTPARLGIPHLSQCLTFNDDGTQLYLAEQNRGQVHQFTLATAWDVTTATHSGNVLNTEPQSIKFNDDGTEFYVLRPGAAVIDQYTLSTGYDLSTASFTATKSLSAVISSGSASIFFKTDGTKLYIMEHNAARSLHQFSLSTPWDVSTTSYDSIYYDFDPDSISPYGFYISSDGLAAYVVTLHNDSVEQYSLGTAWDVSTLSYDSVSYVVPDAIDLAFKSDGSVMFVVDTNVEVILPVTLSTPWDMATATDDRSFDVSAQDSYLQGGKLSSDGTKMYVVGGTNKAIFQYTLSTAEDVATASYASKSCDVSSQVENPTDVFFNADGSKMYVIGWWGDLPSPYAAVFQYTLSTPWDVSTASYDSKTFSVTNEGEYWPQSVFIGASGTKMYVLGLITGYVYQYTLSTPWDVSTASYDSKSFYFASNARSVHFTADGKRMFLLASTSWDRKVKQYRLSTAWDVPTASLEFYFSVADVDSPYGLFFNAAGTRFYIADAVWQTITQYRIYYAWSMFKVGYGLQSFVAFDANINPTSGRFNDDGTIFYSLGTEDYFTTAVGGDNKHVFQYALSTPYDLSTLAWQGKFYYVGNDDGNPQSLLLNATGTKMYVVGDGSNTIQQYSLSTAWDITTAVHDGITFSINSYDHGWVDMFFNEDGTALYIVGTATATVYQFSLSTAWNIATAVYASKSFSVSSQETGPYVLLFAPGGKQMFVYGWDWSKFHQYTLSTPWDVSTASYDSKSYECVAFGEDPYGIVIGENIDKLYTINGWVQELWQYSVDTEDTIVVSVNRENNDGAVDLKVSWTWDNAETDIHGFFLFLKASQTDASYTIGTTPASESATIVPASKREHVFYGVDPAAYYVAGVQPFRRVNTAIDADGLILATMRQNIVPVTPGTAANFHLFSEQGADPADPASGRAVFFVNANGDLIIKINHGGTVKSAILADFSAL